MSFTQSLKGTPTVHFEYKGKLIPPPFPSVELHDFNANIKMVSRGNFELKVTHECTITQDRKQIVKIITVSEFSIIEDTLISLKPDAKICIEAVKETLEYTKEHLYSESENTFYDKPYPMSMPKDVFIASVVNTALRTIT